LRRVLASHLGIGAAASVIGRVARATLSPKLARSDSVNPLLDRDLGVLAIANIAAVDTGAAFPAHRVTSTPNRGYLGGDRGGTPRVALARLARLAGW
jgi:hypothetical protein